MENMGKVKASIETITPDIAREYLTYNKVNRCLSKGQVAYYARMMSEGRWLLNGESIVFDEKGNLADGQHRLNAIILANIPVQSVVVRNVDTEAFTTFDQGKARSASDSFRIKGIANGNNISAGIRRYILWRRMESGSISSVAKSSPGDTGLAKVSTEEHLAVYKESPEFWQNECKFCLSCYNRCRLFSTTDIMGISAYLQLDKGYNAEVVHSFFEQLFFEECTENGSLALLRRIIINDTMSSKGVRMTPKYKTQLLAKCWKAFKENREYKTLRWVKEVEGEYKFE